MRWRAPNPGTPSAWSNTAGRIGTYTALVTALLFGSLRCAAQGTRTPPPEIRARLLDLARSLSADSVLRREIEAGNYGTGTRYPWMDAAMRVGVKRAAVEINFTWHRGVHDLRPVRVMFFGNYDGPDGQITDDAALQKFEKDGLKNLLELAALERARQGSWFESPEHQHPAKRGSVPASTMVILLDDPWLPVGPVWYAMRDVNWSPLDDAAFLDDQVAVKKLLAERKVKQRDLDRALVLAALDDSIAVIHLLVDGGANVNARVKKYGTPLTAAVVNDHPRSVDVLLKAGANPNSKNGSDLMEVPPWTATKLIACRNNRDGSIPLGQKIQPALHRYRASLRRDCRHSQMSGRSRIGKSKGRYTPA